MDTPVFKLYLLKPSFEGVMLPQERVQELMQLNDQNLRDLGIRSLLTGTIFSDERFTLFGAEWYPSWKAVREHQRCLDELHWFQYLQSETYLGVEHKDYPVKLDALNLDPGAEWLAHIFLMNQLPAEYEMTEQESAERMEAMKYQASLGAQPAVVAFTRPFNEQYVGFGIELYPSMEALVEKTLRQEKAKWWKYVSAQSFLGTLDGGDLIKK